MRSLTVRATACIVSVVLAAGVFDGAAGGLALGVQTGTQGAYSFLEVAGSSVAGTRDGQGASAQFTSPAGITRDSAGNIYVADSGAFTVRKITPSGFASTLAGSPGEPGTADGTGPAARFIGPRGIAVDASNNIYVTDLQNGFDVSTYAVRKITSAGVVTTVGTGPVPGFAFDWYGIAVDDRDGAIYVANRGYHIIERFTQAGAYSVFAGTAGSSGTADGLGADARFRYPTGIAVDAAGLVYVSDTGNHTIRRITPGGQVSTWLGVAGDPGPTTIVEVPNNISYDLTVGVDGPAADVRFNQPEALSLDRATGRLLSVGYTTTRTRCCQLLPVNSRNRVRAIAPDGSVTTIVAWAHGAVWAGADVVFTSAPMIWSTTSDGVMTPFAGRGSGCTTQYPIDGNRETARFCSVSSIAVDANGVMFVSDLGNETIRRVTPGGAVTTLAGSPLQHGSTDGDGTDARFGVAGSSTRGMGLDLDRWGYLIVADTANHTIRQIQPNGFTRTIAGTAGAPGATDATGADARFNLPHDVAVDSQNNIFVVDAGNSSIRKLSFFYGGAGNVLQFTGVSTVAGVSGQGGSADGTGSAARFGNPQGIAIGPDNMVYIADTGNHTVRRMTPDGVVTTLAGLAGAAGYADGNGANVRFNAPIAIAVDPDGNVFVGDYSGLRRITPAGDTTTVSLAYSGVSDIDAAGTLYLMHGPQVFVGTQSGSTAAAPSFTAPPVNLTVGAGSTTPGSMPASAGGTPTPTYQWDVSTNGGSTWTALSDGGGITGSTTSTLTFTGMPITANGYRYRAVATNAMGTATSAHAVLMVTGATASPTSLRFAVERYPIRTSTASQLVVATYLGPGTPSWTASVSDPWVIAVGSVTNGARTGAFDVNVNVSAVNFDTAPATLTGSVTLVAANVGASVTIPVTLRIRDESTFDTVGQVDTPIQHAAGVQGAIGVTGWAVHPIGIRSVVVFRNCLVGSETCYPGDEPALRGIPVVRIGNAVFVPGARPDIEAAFPDYPASHIGGWGIQILSNMLPRTTGTFSVHGGQGPITLYVVANAYASLEQTLLSRAWTDTTPVPTTITLDNDAIAKPFGTIDTPASAQTVSGTFANFGWALTPDSDTVADSTDILIPTTGSSMVVFLDGLPTALVAYNQCRGTVGNPVPAGVYCNDDIASIFGNTSPQEALGTRTSNPTRYRNLDAARGAIGAYTIDTTLLTNGLHTMAWSVTDSAGRVEGIGSRYFTVINGSSDAVRAEFGVRSAQRSVAAADRRDFMVVGRTGFDLRRPWTPLHADVNGIRHVRIPVDSGRVELSLGAGIEAGYLEANGERRPLPVGSALDPATGLFTWAPGPGFIGSYRFVFGGPEVLGAGPEVRVDVTLRAETPAAPGESEIRMHLDQAVLGSGVLSAERAVRVEGWALDPQAEIGAGIGAVHVWARRVGPEVLGSWSPGLPGVASPIFLGEAALDIARPDVAAAHGAPFGHAAFRLETTATLPAGEYDITAYVWNWRTARWEDARSARVTVR